MAILYGTQSNGETLPVLVDQFGNLLAKGIDGAPGPEGPPGPPGVGQLPADPYEGALLGWLNGGLAWVGAPPVPIPEGVFGPIAGWDPAGLLTVEGAIPSAIKQGVYVYQCNEDGSIYVSGWNNSKIWSNGNTDGTPTGTPGESAWMNAFNSLLDSTPVACAGQSYYTLFLDNPINEVTDLQAYLGGAAGAASITVNGNTAGKVALPSNGGQWINATPALNSTVIQSITIQSTGGGSAQLYALKANGQLLVNSGNYPSAANLNLRVNTVNGQNLIGVPNRTDNFSIGKYLRVPEQNVARWLYDGNLNKVITSTGIDISRLTGI